MTFVDYYNALGIDKSASSKDIKNAYRKLARKHHPDLNPNDQDAKKNFQLINEANEVLSDPVKRKKYDTHGKDWQHADAFEKSKHEQSSRQPFSGGRSENDFSDFFSSMFGNESGSGGGRQLKYRGEDYNAEIKLSLSDAFTTHQQTVIVDGKNIRITIPAGIENGQTIKITGYGSPGMNGGPNGNLFITFFISHDPVFRRFGNDLKISVELNLYTAILGGDITVDTLAGKVKLKVIPETQNGTKVNLKGKGFPVYKKEGQFGDLQITYQIKLPSHLTEKQKELFMELSKLDK